MNKKNQRGVVTVIFLAIVALVLTLLLAATQSRLLLSLGRSRSASDILKATYQAESEANDVMASLLGGYIEDANISKTVKIIGDMKVEIEGQDLGETQIVTVTVTHGLAVGKVQAIRRILSVDEVDEVEMVLALDCTSSMDEPDADPGCTSETCRTRFEALEQAAVNFVDAVSELEDKDKFKLGISIFGKNAAWLQKDGVNITPGSFNFDDIQTAIENGIGRVRAGSQCDRVTNGTSVGSAFRFGHDYLRTTKQEGTKQIEIVITDGEPNSRPDEIECPGTACGPESSCIPAARNYLRCTVADKLTDVLEISSTQKGTRDPDVDAYSVTVLENPDPDVPPIFQKYGTEGGYFNATNAGQLSSILTNILGKILEDRSTVTIKRVIPTAE